MHLTQTDHMHVIRKRAMHRIISRALRRDTETVMQLAHEGLRRLIEHNDDEPPFIKGWIDIMQLAPAEIAALLIQRSDRMDNLRDSSPFMKMFGYDLGVNMPIDFKDEAMRRRLWAMGKRLVGRHYAVSTI